MATINKTLNATQRRALDKLYQSKFDSMNDSYIDKCNKVFDDGIKALDDNIVDEDFTHYLSSKDSMEYWKKKLDDKYNENGFISFKQVRDPSTGKYETKLGHNKDVYRYGSKQTVSPQVEKLVSQREEAKAKFESIRLEATAKIYGLDVTFAQISADIDKMLKKLA